MARRRKASGGPVQFWVYVIILLVLLYVWYRQSQPGRPASGALDADILQTAQVVSVYDGDTFKINLDCPVEVFCRDLSVRVRGIDTPEIKGKTAREKNLAQQAKQFTQHFLQQTPITLHHCGRDKYFRLLCEVTNGAGKDLAQELIQQDLGYAYDGGTKSSLYQ